MLSCTRNTSLLSLALFMLIAGFSRAAQCDLQSVAEHSEKGGGLSASVLLQVQGLRQKLDDDPAFPSGAVVNATAASQLATLPAAIAPPNWEAYMLDQETKRLESLHASVMQLARQDSLHPAAPFRHATASQPVAREQGSYEIGDPFPHATASQRFSALQSTPFSVANLTLTSQFLPEFTRFRFHNGQAFTDHLWIFAFEAQMAGMCMSLNCLLFAHVWLSKADGSQVSGPYQITRSVPYDGVDLRQKSLATYFIQVDRNVEGGYAVGDKLYLQDPLAQNATAAVEPVKPKGSLHEIVGPDGVLMICLVRQPQRSRFAMEQLQQINIYATVFPATDALSAPPRILNTSCNSRGPGVCERGLGPRYGSAQDGIKTGIGCGTPIEQAIAHSHRRALEFALQREEEWTLILEDDVMPTLDNTSRFDEEFRRVWPQRPPRALILRLNWCSWKGHYNGRDHRPVGPPPTVEGSFMWVHTPWAGGCTSAYMVHKSIIPEFLAEIFPCCASLDACMEWDFFAKSNPRLPNTTRSMTILANLDVWWGSAEYESNHSQSVWKAQNGVLMQATNHLVSSRTGTGGPS